MLETCQFCSVISKNNGEDPIGTTHQYDYWIVIETPLPWNMEKWQTDPAMAPILGLFEQLILQQGIKLRPLAIAPDPAYSHPGYTRVLYYHRPTNLFNQYDKQEYLIPEDQVYPLLLALFQTPACLQDFDSYQQSVITRDLLICTHGNVDVACSRFGTPIYKKLRDEYAKTPRLPVSPSSSLLVSPILRIWRCSHFGGHRFAPTMIDLPTGQFFGHLDMSHLDSLVHRQGRWSHLRMCYRGWSGLNKFEQIAERDIWMQMGWSWFNCVKAGETLDQDSSEGSARVQIKFQRPNGTGGIYKADIDLVGEVETASKSRKAIKLEQVKQYRVGRLVLEET
ncbi:MAG: sucrase ferredoxin [Cyanobacteria bacterium P01_C01_bin.118]